VASFLRKRRRDKSRILREVSMEPSVFVQRADVAVRATIVTMLVWAVFIVPGGAPWTGVAWLGALPVLVVATATLFIGLARTPSTVRADRRGGPGG
jgi:hypothetical protein